jgi:hypothetical protein
MPIRANLVKTHQPQSYGGQCLLALVVALAACQGSSAAENEFPDELVSFVPYRANPVFEAGGPGQWDARIRERGWIIKERDRWRLWYTGYDGTREGRKLLGLATSTDGLVWTRNQSNPLFPISKNKSSGILVHDGKRFRLYTMHDKVHAHLQRATQAQ